MELHFCDLNDFNHATNGPAVNFCLQKEDGTLWVFGGFGCTKTKSFKTAMELSEYATQVNFCPACGFHVKQSCTSQ